MQEIATLAELSFGLFPLEVAICYKLQCYKRGKKKAIFSLMILLGSGLTQSLVNIGHVLSTPVQVMLSVGYRA